MSPSCLVVQALAILVFCYHAQVLAADEIRPTSESVSGRIVGGSAARPGAYPFFGKFRMLVGIILCMELILAMF